MFLASKALLALFIQFDLEQFLEVVAIGAHFSDLKFELVAFSLPFVSVRFDGFDLGIFDFAKFDYFFIQGLDLFFQVRDALLKFQLFI